MSVSPLIINDVIPRTQILATSLQVEFDTDWTADDASDVLVYALPPGDEPDELTQKVDASDYVVTFVGGSQTVRVTFGVGVPVNTLVTIVRNTPADRTNLYTNGNFTPTMLNQDFGILTLVDQQAQLYDKQITPRYNINANVNFNPDTDSVDVLLPILGENEFWAMNSDRTRIVALPYPSQFSGVSPGTTGQIAYYATNGSVVSGADLVAGTNVTINRVGNQFTISASAPDEFPTGTRLVFQQTTAPTGWTKDTTAAINNGALRTVTGTVGTGGTVNFTAAFASQAVAGTVGNTTLDITQIPAHTHTYGGTQAQGFTAGNSINATFANTGAETASTGGGGSHTHTFTGTAIDLAVKYYDVILAQKN